MVRLVGSEMLYYISHSLTAGGRHAHEGHVCLHAVWRRLLCCLLMGCHMVLLGGSQGKLEGCLVGLWKEASQTGGRAYGRAGRKQARAAGWKLFGWRAGGQA